MTLKARRTYYPVTVNCASAPPPITTGEPVFLISKIDSMYVARIMIITFRHIILRRALWSSIMMYIEQ